MKWWVHVTEVTWTRNTIVCLVASTCQCVRPQHRTRCCRGPVPLLGPPRHHDPARVRRCHRLLQLSDLDNYGFYGLELESLQVCRLPVIKPVTSVGDCAIG